MGVSGGSAAGKTMVANMLAERLSEEGALVIGVDRYFLDRSALPPEERARLNYDVPEALNFAQLAVDISTLKAGRPVALPVYDYCHHAATPDAERVEPAPVIIVEGILLFYPQPIQPLLDYRIFVNAERDIRLARRIARDTVERGRSEESVIRQFIETVEPAFEKYTLPTRSQADVTLDWDVKDRGAINRLADAIRSRVI